MKIICKQIQEEVEKKHVKRFSELLYKNFIYYLIKIVRTG